MGRKKRGNTVVTWTPIWALPNINLDEPVESDFFALVPFADRRVQEMKRRHPEFRKFMMRFTDTFRNSIHPALVLRRENAPERLKTSEAATSFRDLLVASMVPYAQSRNIVHDNTLDRVGFSSYFWVYPWMIDRNYEHIIASAPAMLALHEVAKFKGQSSPDLSPITVRRKDFDEPLLQELMRRWATQYTANHAIWENIALFRSLNMANQASLIPAGADATIYDFGRIIGMWVAAFEILVHPGRSGRANLVKVFELLDGVPWIDRRCGYRRFETGTRKKSARRNLACWIYKQMKECRDDFLHGNPVEISDLMIPKSGRPMTSIAPTLFRLGLTSFLDLSWKEQPPPADDAEALAEYRRMRWDFMARQRAVEEALKLSRVSLEQQRRRRQALLEQHRGRRQEARLRRGNIYPS